jgi:hypothetical protein
MNAVIEKFGGVRWEKASIAVELIQTTEHCEPGEAIEALKEWIKDNHIPARDAGTGKILVGSFRPLLHVLSSWILPETDFAFLNLVEIDMIGLRAWLDQKAQSVSKHPGGAPQLYPWNEVEAALERECSRQGGIPSRGHPNRKWRTKSDAYQWVRDHLAHADGGPSDTTMKQTVGPMLPRIVAKLEKGGN